MKDFHLVANDITLAVLLGLCMNVSLQMQTVTVLPWELLETDNEFVKALNFIHSESNNTGWRVAVCFPALLHLGGI
jgi:hypothetical protein